MTEQLQQTPLQLSSPPPDYQTSEMVRTGVSSAYSTFYNPRGLESYWYSCWTQTFVELATPYNGLLIAQPQYPLYISSIYIAERQLRRDFAANGLLYDSSDMLLDSVDSNDFDGDSDATSDESDTSAMLQDIVDSNDDPNYLPPMSSQSVPPQVETPSRTSERLIINKLIKQTAKTPTREDIKNGLEEKKEALLSLKKQFKKHADGDISIGSVLSQHDSNAMDWAPDVVVSHVPTVPLPDSEKESESYKNRAGLKVIHRCCAIIAEIKRSKDRGRAQDTKVATTGSESIYFASAQADLLEYCSAYFEATPTAKSVIALAASGAEWKWGIITRDDVPRFNWPKLQNRQFQNKEAQLVFAGKFTSPLCILGTAKSDKELSKISQQYLYSLVNDDHDSAQ